MRVTLLGAGVPTPAANRFGSAYLLEVEDRTILIDCGPATTYKLTRAGGSAAAVSMLLFTHHHFDHNADYPCFVLTRWDQDVEQSPLRMFGPPPTASLTRKLFDAPDGAFVSRLECPEWVIQEVSASSRTAATNNHARRPRSTRSTSTGPPSSTKAVSLCAPRPTVHVQPYLESRLPC